jgi:hypothetical protein
VQADSAFQINREREAEKAGKAINELRRQFRPMPVELREATTPKIFELEVEQLRRALIE